jgi:hypothetical protein
LEWRGRKWCWEGKGRTWGWQGRGGTWCWFVVYHTLLRMTKPSQHDTEKSSGSFLVDEGQGNLVCVTSLILMKNQSYEWLDNVRSKIPDTVPSVPLLGDLETHGQRSGAPRLRENEWKFNLLLLTNTYSQNKARLIVSDFAWRELILLTPSTSTALWRHGKLL